MEKYNNVYVDMVGDLFHANHVKLFKEAKAFGNNLLVGIHSDETVQNYKCTPILTMYERAEVIDACKYVDKIILNAPEIITEDYLNKHDIDLVVHAHAESKCSKYNKMYENAIKLNKFKRLDYHGGISTTEIKRRVIEQYNIIKYE
jgi:cytidyltransferase-like protein